MFETWTKMVFFVGVQTRSPVRIQLLSSRFQWAFARKMTFIMAHFIWINRVLSSLQLFRRKLSQNTLPTLGFGPIFPSRSGCQSPEKSPKSPTFSSCFLLHVFSKIQPRCPRFLVILKVELSNIILQIFLFGPGFP